MLQVYLCQSMNASIATGNFIREHVEILETKPVLFRLMIYAQTGANRDTVAKTDAV